MKATKEYGKRAKEEGLALFHICIDRRHIKDVAKGGFYMQDSYGVMNLDKAARIAAILREDD